jgi:uncharacterized protein (TIGR04222 family)
MDWLPQPFALLSGPAFLLVYAAFATAVIAVSRFQVRAADRSLDLPLPPVSAERDPSEIAYLRGGGNELLRFAIYDGLRRNLLRVVPPEKRKRARIEARPDAPGQVDAPSLIAEIVSFYAQVRSTDELFASPLPKAAEAEGSQRYAQSLAAERLLSEPAVRAAAARVRMYGIAALLIFAGLRLAQAFATHHRNVGFLIIETFAAIVILLMSTKVPRISLRGRALLDRLCAALRPPSVAPAGAGPVAAGAALLPIFVAATGLGALAGTEYAPVSRLFPRTGSDGGCGSASSGGSSSCGGGGGCGGGCGG